MRRTAGSLALLLSAALASSALCQDPPKPTEPPPPTTTDPKDVKQDTVKITGIVETWYKLVQEKDATKLDQIGYAHERISKAGPTKYAYFFEADGEYVPPGESGIETEHVSIQVIGQLEEDFDPTQLKINYTYGAKTLSIELNSAPDKRFLEIKTAEGMSVQLELDPQDSYLLFDAITLFRMRQRGELGKPGDVKTNVPPLEGSDYGNATATVGKGESRDFLGKKDTWVTPVHLVVDGIELPGDYAVDRFGRTLERKGLMIAGMSEANSLKGVRMQVAMNQLDAKGETTGLSTRGRRDPFYKLGVLIPVKKGPVAKGPGVKNKEPEPPPVVPGEEVKEIERLAAVVKELRAAVANNSEAEARKKYDAFLRGYKNLRDLVLGNPQQLSQLDQLKFDAEKHYGGAEKLLADAESRRQAILAFLEALALDEIDKRIKEMEKMRDRLELYNEDERRAKLEEKIRDGGKSREKCLARIDLAKKKIDLTGVVVSTETVLERLKLDFSIGGARVTVDEPVRVNKAVAFAVINGELYREGDTIKIEGVRVDKIDLQSIEISYKEELRYVGLRK